MGIRCVLAITYVMEDSNIRLSCRAHEFFVGSSGPLVGDLRYSPIEVVVFGAVGPREDVMPNGVHLQWFESVPVTRLNGRPMAQADWMNLDRCGVAVRTVRR